MCLKANLTPSKLKTKKTHWQCAKCTFIKYTTEMLKILFNVMCIDFKSTNYIFRYFCQLLYHSVHSIYKINHL